MTNVATVLETAPEVASHIREIVCMGGGFFGGGNTTPVAEFNVFVDPDAAQIVLHCGAPVTMLPLDVTHKALMTDAWIDQVRALGTRTGAAAAGMLDFYERYDVDKYGTTGGPLHDPNTIAYLLRPDLYQGRHCNVEVETQSPLTTGMTVVDWWNVTPRPPNCLYITEIDSDGFYDLNPPLPPPLGRLVERRANCAHIPTARTPTAQGQALRHGTEGVDIDSLDGQEAFLTRRRATTNPPNPDPSEAD